MAFALQRQAHTKTYPYSTFLVKRCYFCVMKIHKIEIKNFKGFADETFHFNPHFTVIIGDNATGKTSILEALSVALGSVFIDIENVSTRTIAPKEVRLIRISGQPKPQKPVKITAFGELDGINLDWARGIETTKTTQKDAKKLRDIIKGKINHSRQISGESFPMIAYYSTARLWAEHEKAEYQVSKEGIEMAYRNCLSAKSSSKEFLDWYKTQEDSVFKFNRPLEIAHLNAFKNTIIDLLPQNTWKDMFFDRKSEQLVGTFVDKQGTEHTLEYRQLSDGYRNVIGLAADIAYRCIQLNPHLGENAVIDTKGVVLIDELDLHLHPNWQMNIVDDLKGVFPNIQFITTTHSPFITQSVSDVELIDLDKGINDVQINPKDLPLSKVATDVIKVKGTRSNDFKERFEKAKQEFDKLENESPTMEDYLKISEALGNLLESETDNPIEKAFLNKKNKKS